MLNFLLLFLISAPAFALSLDQCKLDSFSNSRSSTIAIDHSRIRGEVASNLYKNMTSEIKPYFDVLGILRWEKKEIQIVLESGFDYDECNNAYKHSANLETICIRGVSSDVVCEQRCTYLSEKDPDCNY